VGFARPLHHSRERGNPAGHDETLVILSERRRHRRPSGQPYVLLDSRVRGNDNTAAPQLISRAIAARAAATAFASAAISASGSPPS